MLCRFKICCRHDLYSETKWLRNNPRYCFRRLLNDEKISKKLSGIILILRDSIKLNSPSSWYTPENYILEVPVWN